MIHIEKANELFCRKFHCSQAVFAAFAEELGLKYGQAVDQDMDSRQKTNEVTDRFMADFIEENGSYMCKELLGRDISTQEGIAIALERKLFTEFCPKMVESATRIAENILKQ